MPKRNIDKLCAYVHRMCGCSTHGGRVLVVDEVTCVLSDIPMWTEEMTACVKSNFPGSLISVHGTTQSLTGFNVVIKLQPPPGLSGSLLGALLATAVFAGSVWWWIYNHAPALTPPPR